MTHAALTPDAVAVVTGGASGIGLAAAMRFAAAGLKVCIADRGGERLGAAAAALAAAAPGGGESVMAVEVDEGTSSAGTPRKLFNVPGVMQEWGVTKDGSRFLFAVPVGPTPPLTIVRDWQAGLPK